VVRQSVSAPLAYSRLIERPKHSSVVAIYLPGSAAAGSTSRVRVYLAVALAYSVSLVVLVCACGAGNSACGASRIVVRVLKIT
jgi:hypothetical protein